MNEQSPDSRNFGSLHRSQDSIPQKSRPHSAALKPRIDGKPANHHYRCGVGHVASYTARRMHVIHGAHGKRIVTHDLLPRAHHISPRGAVLLIRQCSALEPIVKRRFAALKLR